MKKLNKRARAPRQISTVQQYKDCSAIGEAACIYECRSLGTDNYGMTFPRAENQAKVKS